MASVRSRLLALLLPTLLFVLLAVAVSGYFAASRRIGDFLDADLAESARVLLLWALAEPRAGDEVNAANIQRELDELFGGFGDAGRADDAGGNRVARHLSPPIRLDYVLSRPGIIERVASDEALGGLAACGAPGYARARDPDGRTWHVYTAVGGTPPATVCVGQLDRQRRGIVIAMLVPSMGWWLLALPLTALTIVAGVRRGIAPLGGITRELERRRSGELAPLSVEPPQEVRPLIEALNRLLARQRQLIEQERRFSAEAAHELRTPLATVRLRAERALSAAETTSGPARTALQSIIEESVRAERVLGQLLALARIDAADAEGLALTSIRLLPVLREVLADQADEALERGVDLSLEVATRDRADPSVLAEPVSLKLLVRNLVDNAARYSPRGSCVRISVLEHGQDFRLAVTDAGPGISPSQRRLLCEPFKRGDRHDETGTGLGLAIARRVAALHGARLAMEDGPEGRGLEVSVTLQGAG